VTRQVALIGKPLNRRHSQVMHDAAFDACGIDARYVLREIEPDKVEGVVAVARGPDWLGLGVTAPYKQVVAGLVDEVEGDAQAIGAVNNVVSTDDGRLIGFNSDAPGFRAGVEAAMGGSLSGTSVVVAGAGGAAHAVVYALLTGGVAHVTVGARSPDAARTLLDRFADVGEGDRLGTGLDSEAFRDALSSADLAVNATTVGMIDPGMTIDVDALPPRATVFDLVYVPPETALLAAARARGLRAANGSEMLIQQAAIAFQRWTGMGGMADVMRTAVAPLLADPTVTA
jgi:shikimate dehydrogenase